MSLGIFDERTVLGAFKIVLPADGTGAVALVPINSGDRRIDTISVVNRDGIAHVVNLLLVNGATTIQLGSASIPANQGYAGTPALDLLALIQPATSAGITLQPGDTLSVSMAVAIVATFDVSFRCSGGAF
jgi:hypothetical protein